MMLPAVCKCNYFSSQKLETTLKAYLIMATVSCKLSIYKDLLSGLRQFLTFRFLSTLFSVLSFLRCQSMNYMIMEFKKLWDWGGREGKRLKPDGVNCVLYTRNLVRFIESPLSKVNNRL